jgi:hypothetical protein
MSTNVDPQRSIAAWLEAEAPERAPERLIDASREQIRTTPQRPAWWPARRTSDMGTYTKWVIAAAAVVVVAIVGYNLLPARGGVGVAPSPSPSPSPVHSGSLEAGTYRATLPGTKVTLQFTVPTGWTWDDPGILTKTGADLPDGQAIGIWTGDVQVYTDPCQWRTANPSPPTGPTAQAVIDGLAVQPQRHASAPVIRRGAGADGPEQYGGWAIDLTVPTDTELVGGPCYMGEFRSWGPNENARYHQGPGQRDTVWAVDVDGARVVVDAASFPETPTAVMTEQAVVVSSMVFGHSS